MVLTLPRSWSSWDAFGLDVAKVLVVVGRIRS